MRQPVVDVIVIGAMKSGTTALYHYFKKTGAFSVNKHKETNYFLEPTKPLSLEAYDKTFLRGNVRVDVSPNYSKFHQYQFNVAREIFNVNPDAKIIYLVRDPIERIESHLYHNLIRHRIRRRLFADFNALKEYVLTSSYSLQITPYLETMPKNNILVVQHELMRKDPGKFIAILSIFLDVNMTAEKLSDVYNSADQRYWIPKYDFMRRLLGQKIFRGYSLFWGLFNIKPDKARLNDNVKSEIREYLREDISRFCNTFDVDKKLWKSFFS